MASYPRPKVLLKLVVLAASVFLFATVFRVLFKDNFSDRISSGARFSTSPSLRLPYRDVARPLEEILEAEWVPQLWRYLENLKTSRRHVSLCVADSRYKESVVNWLVSALVIVQPPLDNVLVVSLDEELTNFLQGRELNSVFVDPHTILRRNVHLPTNYSHVWATRFVLFRLINHWGFSVTTFDSDALLARNPQPLFDERRDSDIVASPGTYPFDLRRVWNSSTLCMGMALFRASEKIEKFWDHFSVVQQSMRRFDDQVVINNALKNCGIVWSSTGKDSGMLGVCRDLNFKVSLLPRSVVCRKCKKTTGGSFYVWHQTSARGQAGKKKIAKAAGMWFLKRNLDESELKGTEWLRYLWM